MLPKNKNHVPKNKYCNLSEKCIQIIQHSFNDGKTSKILYETNLSDLNISSIVFIKTIIALEKEFDFEFDDEMLLITAFPTIKSIIEYVELELKDKLLIQ